VTVKLAGVDGPEDALRFSQGTLLEAVQLTEDGVEARLTVCAPVTAPGAAAKLSDAGVAVKVGVTAGVTVKVTLTWTTGPADGVIVTMPL
jgi:hypothetical protein